MRIGTIISQIQILIETYNFPITNIGGDKMSEFNLSLMNLDSETLGIPETEFNSICTLPSNEFSRICREYGSLSETIKIETNKDHIKFSITG